MKPLELTASGQSALGDNAEYLKIVVEAGPHVEVEMRAQGTPV